MARPPRLPSDTVIATFVALTSTALFAVGVLVHFPRILSTGIVILGRTHDRRWQQTPGAYLMGHNMFGPGRGEWELAWKGWWGDEPPYHAPVFVLTHHAREPLRMEGGTTFHFVTDGLGSALEQAKAAADGRNVEIAGGASTVNAYLGAGVVEELHLHISPVLLGAGERLFEGVSTRLRLEPLQAIGSTGATHVKYRVG